MARRRYVSTDISVDPRVSDLALEAGPYAALLYTWLIPHADDTRAIPSDPRTIKLQVVPGLDHCDVQTIAEAVDAMLRLGLLVDDCGVLRFPIEDWEQITLPPTRLAPLHPMRVAWNRIKAKVSPIIFARDGYRCRFCGARFPLEVDHEIAIVRGGTNDESNLQTLCRPCNRRKWAH